MFCLTRIQIFRDWGIYFSRNTSYQSEHQKSQSSLFEQIIPDTVVARLRQDGIYVGINLPDRLLPEILDFAVSTSYLGNANTQLEFLLLKR